MRGVKPKPATLRHERRVEQAGDIALGDEGRRRSGELRPLSEKIGKFLGFEEIVGSAPEFRAALPRTAAGELTKSGLQDPYGAGHDRANPLLQPEAG